MSEEKFFTTLSETWQSLNTEVTVQYGQGSVVGQLGALLSVCHFRHYSYVLIHFFTYYVVSLLNMFFLIHFLVLKEVALRKGPGLPFLRRVRGAGVRFG